MPKPGSSHPQIRPDSPSDVIVVTQVVPLSLFFHTVQHSHGGHKVDHLPGGKEVKVGPAVPASVAVAGDAQGWVKEPVQYLLAEWES